ncbi:hypothetical protein OEZ85_013624 [Tetradesmus obliquus]|uniref:Peptidase S8/S53 domain-containing protein n=1 Tax=Tetradesmus obliquus TaxID=3088 RepID=A0ABY8URZ5_TETOB|nr:hypothetical protein OEZ85_013624 [Tetradesmus obliquus]
MLLQNPAVKKVWVSAARPLVKPVDLSKQPASTGSSGSSSSSSSEASGVKPGATAAAPTAATDGSVVATGLSRLAKRHPGLDGTGTLICMIDTGLQYTLPAFGGCSGINAPVGSCNVVVGRDMVGSRYDGSPGSLPQEGDAPLDCYDHGTKVASVAGTANGVAPGAKLGIYRIFGCRGVATDAVIIPALDRAVKDGCHIINLSAASGSGFEERSPYADVMEAAYEKGVLAVKSAGNSGTSGVFFESDVALAVGSITVGSIGAGSIDVDDIMVISDFSSFGPHPALQLSPHICAPGSYIKAYSKSGSITSVSGTSFSCPFMAGVLALWRQGKQQEAKAAGRALRPAELNQASALRAIVSTADMVRSQTPGLVEPIARCGGGVIQADALLDNQINVDPMMIQLSSNLRRPWVTAVRLTWTGAAPLANDVTFEVKHVPAYSLDITNNWYGTDLESNSNNATAIVTALTPRVTLRAGPKPTAIVRLNFTLLAELTRRPLLYSGIIRLLPITTRSSSSSNSSSNSSGSSNMTSNSNTTSNSTGNSTDPPAPTPNPSVIFVPLVIPYQGYSQDYRQLPIMARVINSSDDANDYYDYYANQLAEHAKALCYAPRSAPSAAGNLMDYQADVPYVCDGGFAETMAMWINVSLGVLQDSPECSLRVTLAPQTPMQWLYVDLLHARNGTKIGSLQPLDTSANGPLVSTHEVWSWCLGFNGTYTPVGGGSATLTVGFKYRIAVNAVGPSAARDAANKIPPRRERVLIRGVINVVP